jgi:tetratricopeptide (TPR) repeat protein
MNAARRARSIAGAALLLMAGVAGAEAQDPRMIEIVGLIREGKRTEAIDKADAMIAGFSATQHEPGVSYFCNRDRGGVANMLAAARQGAKVDLAPEAWCEALFVKGYALTDLKRFDQAGEALGGAVAMDPSNPHFRNQYGDILRLRGDPVSAIVQYSKAYHLAIADEGEQVAPMVTRALRGMALASEDSGDLAAAQGYYEKLLARDSGDADARTKLAAVVRKRVMTP